MENRAIWTFIADDGLFKSCLKYQGFFKEFHLRGTVALVTDWVDNHCSTDHMNLNSYMGSWDEWIDIVKNGYIDIANHTKSHKKLTEAIDLDSEINDALKRFPFEVLGMVCPYGSSNNIIIEKIKEKHLANRISEDGYNSIGSVDWFRLKTKIACNNLDKMNDWIDVAISEKKWIIENWHGLDDEGWNPVDSIICKKHFEYVLQKNIEVLSYNDVIKRYGVKNDILEGKMEYLERRLE